jgi:hypothetical protein
MDIDCHVVGNQLPTGFEYLPRQAILADEVQSSPGRSMTVDATHSLLSHIESDGEGEVPVASDDVPG